MTKFNTKPENVYVLDIETKTGTQSALCGERFTMTRRAPNGRSQSTFKL